MHPLYSSDNVQSIVTTKFSIAFAEERSFRPKAFEIKLPYSFFVCPSKEIPF